jgi:hypothetical protein
MKLVTIAIVVVVAGAGIAILATNGQLSFSNPQSVTPQQTPVMVNVTHNATTNATHKATVKPTATPTTPVATPDNRRPDGTVATPVATATPLPTIYPSEKIYEDSLKTQPTATPAAKIPTQVDISSSPVSIKSGENVVVAFTVTAKTVPIAGATVKFDINGKQLGSATTGSNGMGVFQFSTKGLTPILPAAITLGGTYAGNSQYASSWGTMGYYVVA